MIPSQTRTGEINIKERGFTSHFSVDGDSHSFSVRYYKDCWRTFPDHMKKQLAELVSSVWVAAIPSVDKVFTHRLSEPDIEYLKYIAYQTQGLYRRNMSYPAMEGKPTLHVTEGNNDWSGLELDSEGCGVYFSGGRDAFCTLGMLEDAGYDPQLIQVNNGSSWDAGEKAREEFTEELDRPIDTAWNNFSLLKREITKDHGVFWHLEAPIFQMTWLMSLPMLEHGLMFFGNEATTTRFVSVGKDRVLHHSWEQSLLTNHVMTQWAEAHDIGLRVGSILREMGDYRVVKELYERFPEYWDLSVSCFFVDTDNEYSPCSKCHKCQRNYLCLKAIAGDVSHYDEDRIEEYGLDPANLMWKTVLPNDLSHINYKTNMFMDVPNQERPEIEGLMFKHPRSNPSHFLTRDEFKSIYQSVMDDDDAWMVDQTPVETWDPLRDLDHIYDELIEWDMPKLDTKVRVKDNNSLLNI